MDKFDLSVVVIAKNESEMIKDCLSSVSWAKEILVVDSGSTDNTVEIAKKMGARVLNISSGKMEFSRWRNIGLKEATGKWLFYLDADERATPQLKEELREIMAKPVKYYAYQLPRRNFYLGREMHYGGAWPSYVKRFFLKEKLSMWERELHEDPVFEGELGTIANPILHYTHRDLSSMLVKTKEWSKIEANLLYKANHPPVTWWRLIRIMLTEFWERGIKLKGIKDGTEGWIEVIFQMFSRFLTYARLWELQDEKNK